MTEEGKEILSIYKEEFEIRKENDSFNRRFGK